ncbi:unnamed protein product, partial [Rotaria sordida]
RLSEYGRKTTIQLIQPYYELDQFLIFIEKNLPLLKSLENRYLKNNKNDTTIRYLFLERIHYNLLSQWQLSDVIRSSIQTWDDIVTNRSLFLDVLDELIGGPRMIFTSRLKATEFDPLLIDYKVQSLLDMSYCALRQHNFKLALTKLNETHHCLDLCQNSLIKSIYWNEIYCDVHLKCHQIQSSTSTLSNLLSTSVVKEFKKMEIKISSLKIIDQQTAQLNSNYIQLNSQFCRTVIDFLFTQSQEMYLYSLENNNNQIQQTDQLIYELFNKCIHILKENIEKQETDLQNLSVKNILSRDYNDLVSICDDYLRRYENNENENSLLTNLFNGDNGNNIAELIVKSVLLSMKYDSNEGVKCFSRLLQIVDFKFLCWSFFDCLYQITAYLNKPITQKELFHLLTNDLNIKDINKLQEHLIKFKQILFSDIINLDETNDEQLILSNTQDNNDIDDNTVLKPKITSIRILFKNAVEKEFNDIFGKNGELLSTILLGDTRLILSNISLKLKNIIQDKTNINDYSTWFSSTFRQQNRILDKLSIRELEIPGQCTIKAREDIRQDQRIEALFSIMNDLYDNDPNCNQSNSAHIAVRTYKVIPMSSKLGMIEWLDNTRPLKDLIEELYNDNELDIITNQGQHPRKLYQDYVTNTYQKAKPTAKTANNTVMYAELFLSLTKAQVQEEFNHIQSVIPADLLRRAYYKIAISHEGFYTLRRQFITSYAVLCTSQYILGIGDRHQSKYVKYSRDQIQHLSVPELIPIRLTRQFTQLMSHIGRAGLFRATMIHRMNALRQNSDLLVSTMDGFIKEALME